nr:hypothetical protein [Tanacetum cinerariifolium]
RRPGLIRGVISGRFLGLFHLETFIEHVMIWILRLEWRTNSGLVKPFSILNVWKSIRPRFEVVTWHDDVNSSLIATCSLCGSQPDSHSYLFFDCGYSTQIWDHMKALADISNMMGDYKDVVAFLSLHVKRRTCKSVIGKLVFSASVYYIWQERNARIFSNQKRSSCQLKEVIHSAVRIKLLSCSFKKTRSGLVFARIWKLPEYIFSSKTR